MMARRSSPRSSNRRVHTLPPIWRSARNTSGSYPRVRATSSRSASNCSAVAKASSVAIRRKLRFGMSLRALLASGILIRAIHDVRADRVDLGLAEHRSERHHALRLEDAVVNDLVPGSFVAQHGGVAQVRQ